MATRRSNRLQNLPVPAPAAAPEPAPPLKKRKAPPTKAAAVSKKKVAASTNARGKKLSVPSMPGTGKEKLSSLPPEVMNLILDKVGR
jgi:hypothetical protein